MNFIVRPVTTSDLPQLLELAKQFSLLNLPGDRRVLQEKIERSLSSFASQLPKGKAEYLFVLEDVEERLVMGSSLIMAKHGSEDIPHSFFKVLKREHFSQDLGIGFIHQVLRYQIDTDGPTEIGGLLIDRNYRRRPEKLGKQISLSRFLYIATHREDFEDRILCELTPPLTDEGRSEFWEALGRRFTGLPYQEADLLSQTHKEFITSLFPQEDIYLCLLDAKARLVLGRVGTETQPAKHLLENIGFVYTEEVDPFDGGPHYSVQTSEVLPIKQGLKKSVSSHNQGQFARRGLLATMGDDFRCALVHYDEKEDGLVLPERTRKALDLNSNDQVFLSPFDYSS